MFNTKIIIAVLLIALISAKVPEIGHVDRLLDVMHHNPRGNNDRNCERDDDRDRRDNDCRYYPHEPISFRYRHRSDFGTASIDLGKYQSGAQIVRQSGTPQEWKIGTPGVESAVPVGLVESVEPVELVRVDTAALTVPVVPVELVTVESEAPAVPVVPVDNSRTTVDQIWNSEDLANYIEQQNQDENRHNPRGNNDRQCERDDDRDRRDNDCRYYTDEPLSYNHRSDFGTASIDLGKYQSGTHKEWKIGTPGEPVEPVELVTVDKTALTVPVVPVEPVTVESLAPATVESEIRSSVKIFPKKTKEWTKSKTKRQNGKK